jgi:hypothetical protein
MTTINVPAGLTAGQAAVSISATGLSAPDQSAATWNSSLGSTFSSVSVVSNPNGDSTGTASATYVPAAAGTDTVSFSDGTDADNASTDVVVGASGGGGGTANPALTNASVIAAQAAMAQVQDFTSTAACGPVKAFQSAWNAAGGTPSLTVDGGYGVNTASASGAVAAANGLGAVQGGLSGGFPNCGGAVTPPATPPNNTTPTTTGSSGMPTWLKWVLGIIVVGGIGALGYWAFFTPSGKRMFAGESKKKRRQRKARASARKRRGKKK